MSTKVFLMILVAALVHASWNALVKADGDRVALVKTMFLTQFACSICLIPFVPFPAHESWPYLCAGAVLGTGYMLFLNWAYQVGDLSHVYPFARGTAPLIVAIISVAFLGEHIGHIGEVAVVLIAVGVASLAMTRGAAGFREPRPVLFSLTASGFVAGYTIADGLGARSAGSPHAYMAWGTLLYAVLVAGSFQMIHPSRQTRISERTRRNGIVTGLMSYGSSWVAIWAFTRAPIALVSALREISTVFAVVIGVVFLKERLSLMRLASIATTLIGATVLKLSR
jgi:drug/metabolite transporter (DMT)-like permease